MQQQQQQELDLLGASNPNSIVPIEISIDDEFIVVGIMQDDYGKILSGEYPLDRVTIHAPRVNSMHFYLTKPPFRKARFSQHTKRKRKIFQKYRREFFFADLDDMVAIPTYQMTPWKVLDIDVFHDYNMAKQEALLEATELYKEMFTNE